MAELLLYWLYTLFLSLQRLSGNLGLRMVVFELYQGPLIKLPEREFSDSLHPLFYCYGSRSRYGKQRNAVGGSHENAYAPQCDNKKIIS